MRRSLIVLLVLICPVTVNIVTSQESNDFMSFRNFNPPSPELALFQRYGDIPVNPSSGITSLDIPFFEIKSGQQTLPVSISYLTSGIKAEDMASPVGLGWVLNAGGSVSRNVIGVRDELPYTGFLNIDSYKTRASIHADPFYSEANDNLLYLNNMAEGNWDTQSDQYYINVPGLSCRFLYGTDKKIHHDASDRKIIIDRNLADDSFTVTDDNGTRYIFSEKEYTLSVEIGYKDPTAWMLTKIISGDGVDSIIFKYKAANQYSDIYVSHQMMFKDANTGSSFNEECCNSEIQGYLTTSLGNYLYDRILLDSIIFSSGKIKLNYVTDREDPIDERLAGIVLYSVDGPVKSISLKQSYFISNSQLSERYNKRLRLNSVDFRDSQEKVVSTYSFDYNPVLLPAYRSDGMAKTIEYDYWGYYNGSGAKTLIPDGLDSLVKSYVLDCGFESFAPYVAQYRLWASDRKANEYYAAACILNKINYPTGGYTTFEYEGNRDESGNLVGGVRIKTTISYDPLLDKNITKTYVYGNGDGNGINLSRLLPYTFYYLRPTIFQKNCYTVGDVNCSGNDFFVSSSSVTPINFFGGSPVFYNLVTVYEGSPGSNNGRTVYTYDYEPDKNFGFDAMRYGGFKTNSNWRRGQLLNRKVYDSRNILKQETRNRYLVKGFETVTSGYICDKTTEVNIHLGTFLSQTSPNSPYADKNLFTYFDYVEVDYDFGIKLLSETEEYDYLEGGTVLKRTNYFYESPKHTYLSRKETLQSDGIFLIENYKYPEDKSEIQGLSAGGREALDALIEKNTLTPMIEKNFYKGSSFLERNIYEYRIFSKEIIKTGYRKRQIGSGQLQTEFTFFYDKHGNIVEHYKENGPVNTVIWGYNNQLPVANIENATLTEVQKVFGGSLPETGSRGLSMDQAEALRSALPGALVSVFNYKPLVGLSSMTDPAGLVTYYDYDDFGRLIRIRNDDENIIKAIEYNYRKQP